MAGHRVGFPGHFQFLPCLESVPVDCERGAMRELIDANTCEIKERYSINYNGKCVKLQKEGSISILEIFHDIYTATVNTIELDDAIKSNEIIRCK